jgi:hypothetical protein
MPFNSPWAPTPFQAPTAVCRSRNGLLGFTKIGSFDPVEDLGRFFNRFEEI